MITNLQMSFKLLLILYASFLHFSCSLHSGEALANLTAPQEIEALKTIAKKMQNTQWNFSEDPCSGKGSWNVSQPNLTEQEVSAPKNLVACNCTLKGDKFCHVTQIFLKERDLPGVIPPELSNLTYLEEIDLYGNYLSGSIPPELGSLTHLKSLSIGSNRLSGYIPKEFGNLTSLKTLVLTSNNLHGQLPPQLSYLKNLERLNIGNNEFSGEIPPSFSYFKALKDFRADSNNFKGEIPDFIGNWMNINTLTLQATSLKGPIPSTFSGLFNLIDMRISDLDGGGSTLSFMQNLTNLKTIVLKNALIHGEIPKSIGHFKKLKTLDLRFNNLTGSIPDTLEEIKQEQLEYLYLGNNNLTGTLQPWLNEIMNVDLSYNNFSGDFPPLAPKPGLNLIGNSFKSNLSNRRDEAYLQRGFICEKGDPHYTSLAINCGGEDINLKSIHFEGDQNQLGPSTFYLNPTKKNWAVSNTGHATDNESHVWLVTTNYSQFNTVMSQDLYKTARSAPTSLRYYGLCLHNGPYKVQLHFTEIQFSNKKSFRSLGRRIFDVYVQGTRKLQNFNIEDVAGGPYKVVVKNFTINVTENYLEIHFFGAGKGTYNIPDQGDYGPLVSAIIISSEFKIKNTRSNRNMIIGIIFGVVISLGLALCLSFIFIKKLNGTDNRFMAAQDDRDLSNLNTVSNTFSIEEIRNATSDFHSENKIGEGGFGVVFKGILPDGKMVAVKQMFSKSRQGSREFLNELGTISAVQHPNLVKLYGCCIEGKQLLLIYEYMENNSLGKALFGPTELKLKLNWPERYNICLGVARGLAYLHEESRLRIIHRDIKATNILLDAHLNPKISDFGLAKLFDLEKTHVSTRVAGTIGYMSPEYALKGQLTEKADVYSFGVVILEIVSGRAHTDKKLEGEMVYLLEWIWYLYEENRVLDLTDANLKYSRYSEEEVLRVINVGLLCTHANPMRRPSMSTVIGMLEGKIEARVSHSRPAYLFNCQSNVDIEERPLSLSASLSLEAPWKGSSSSQPSSSTKQPGDDNKE